MTFVDFREIFFFMKSVLLGERVLEIWKPGNQSPETAKSLVKGGLGIEEVSLPSILCLSTQGKNIIFSGCVLCLLK